MKSQNPLPGNCQILAVNIGTESRKTMGYKTIKDFIKEKERIIIGGDLTTHMPVICVICGKNICENLYGAGLDSSYVRG